MFSKEMQRPFDDFPTNPGSRRSPSSHYFSDGQWDTPNNLTVGRETSKPSFPRSAASNASRVRETQQGAEGSRLKAQSLNLEPWTFDHRAFHAPYENPHPREPACCDPLVFSNRGWYFGGLLGAILAMALPKDVNPSGVAANSTQVGRSA
jgi:hypothetical protein